MQVSEACYRYGRGIGAKVVPVYGGQPIFRQLGALRDGVHIVVATPGRAIDHINRGTLALAAVKLVVLDEADEMLDMGFAEDIEAILEATPDDPPDGAVLGDDAAAHRAHRPPLHARPGAHRDRAGGRRQRRAAADHRAGVRRHAGPQGGRPRAHPRRRGAGGGDRVLPHAHRGRRADRDAERPRLPRRGAARRHEPGGPRPRHGPAAQRHGRAADRHRRRRPWPRRRHPHPRRQLRRARRRRTPTSTASGASGGPGERASPSRSPSPASCAC